MKLSEFAKTLANQDLYRMELYVKFALKIVLTAL